MNLQHRRNMSADNKLVGMPRLAVDRWSVPGEARCLATEIIGISQFGVNSKCIESVRPHSTWRRTRVFKRQMLIR